MRGSIRKRQGKRGVSYLVRVEYPADPVTGQRQQRAETFPTRKQAETALAQWTAKVQTGMAVLPDRLTVAELMGRWLEDVAKHRLKETTWQGYKRTIVRHVTPQLGSIHVQKLSAADVQRALSALRTDGVGARSVQLAYLRLSQALSYAERMQLVPRNVCDQVDAPKAPAKRGQTWTADEARRFLAKAETATYAPLWHVLLAAGCRIGEALGLRWQDVDLAGGAIHIERTLAILQRGKGEHLDLVFQTPKSTAGRRAVAQPPDVMAALKRHRTAAKERALQVGTGWREDALVFATTKGTPIDPNNARRVFDRLCEEANVPAIRPHDTRHTNASLLIAAGVPIPVVSERLGHAKPSITADIYSHVLASSRDHATETVGAILFDDAKTERAS